RPRTRRPRTWCTGARRARPRAGRARRLLRLLLGAPRRLLRLAGRLAGRLLGGAGPLLRLALADLRDALLERHLELLAGLRRVVEVGEQHARQPLADGLLDVAQLALLVGGDEGEGITR
ncbi:hypothetical protein RZS08_54055, partial [Arthrospira platensis SPKY1]|nr:hypothetical protein [Arthrospira platensis SPKY1]